jgi:hypothetical protein
LSVWAKDDEEDEDEEEEEEEEDGVEERPLLLPFELEGRIVARMALEARAMTSEGSEIDIGETTEGELGDGRPIGEGVREEEREWRASRPEELAEDGFDLWKGKSEIKEAEAEEAEEGVLSLPPLTVAEDVDELEDGLYWELVILERLSDETVRR